MSQNIPEMLFEAVVHLRAINAVLSRAITDTQSPDNTMTFAKANSALCGTSPIDRVVPGMRLYREEGK